MGLYMDHIDECTHLLYIVPQRISIYWSVKCSDALLRSVRMLASSPLSFAGASATSSTACRCTSACCCCPTSRTSSTAASGCGWWAPSSSCRSWSPSPYSSLTSGCRRHRGRTGGSHALLGLRQQLEVRRPLQVQLEVDRRHRRGQALLLQRAQPRFTPCLLAQVRKTMLVADVITGLVAIAIDISMY